MNMQLSKSHLLNEVLFSTPFEMEIPAPTTFPFPFFPTVFIQFRSVIQSCLILCNPMELQPHEAHQASLSITNSQSLVRLTSIELVMPSNHFILCHPLLLLPSIFPSIRVFSKKSSLHIRWPKYWSFSLNISPSNEYSGL